MSPWIAIPLLIVLVLMAIGVVGAYGDARYMRGREDERKHLFDRGWRGP